MTFAGPNLLFGDVFCSAADSPSASKRFSAPLDRQVRQTTARPGAATGIDRWNTFRALLTPGNFETIDDSSLVAPLVSLHGTLMVASSQTQERARNTCTGLHPSPAWYCRYSSPSERYTAEAHPPKTASGELEKTTPDRFDDVPTSLKQVGVDHYDWGVGLHSAISYVAATDVPLMISPSGYLGKTSHEKGSQEVRGSPVSTLTEQFTAAPRARGNFRAWKPQRYGGRGPTDDAEVGVWTEYAEERQGIRSPCRDTSSQQSEKDQRMWSALKTSLLTGCEGDTDPPFFGFGIGRTEGRASPHGGSDGNADAGNTVVGEERNNAFLKGTRDMEQLDLERSAMDRTMRPHRVASARLLETTQASPVQTKVGGVSKGGTNQLRR